MLVPRRRFLVLGLDGGTFDLLDPLMKAGELPFLSSLVANGLRAPLTSVFPPKTIPAWYSFATGLDPGALGVFGFAEPDGGPGRSRFIRTLPPVETVWDHLSRRGIRVGLLNFPVKAGCAVNGFFVPGFITQTPITYPRGLGDDIARAVGGPYPLELPPYRDPDRAEWMATATHHVQYYAKAVQFLMDRHHPDFLFVLLRETDRVEHQHWAELSAAGVDLQPDQRIFWRAVDASCRDIDAAFRAGGSPATTLVVSDHGHGLAESDFLTNRWLADEGFLRFKQANATWRRDLVARGILFAQRFHLARRLMTALSRKIAAGGAERLTETLTGASNFEAMSQQIDWDRTLAISYPVPEGIYVNRYNRSITPDQARAIVREIRTRLEAYPDARIEVLEPEKIYQGQRLENAPQLFLRINDMRTETRMDFNYPTAMVRDRPSFFYGSGTHRMDGILIATGDGVVPGPLDGPAHLLDLAPTILEGMGFPVPSRMTGRSFADRLGKAW